MKSDGNRSQEKGGILIELTLFAFILTLFGAGAICLHRALHRRFEKIVHHRNEEIRSARGQKAKFLFDGG